jgi:hypothetical protein
MAASQSSWEDASVTEPYFWQEIYRDAVLETDPAKMPTRIDAALMAINQRLHNPIEINSPEHKEIEHALRALEVLKAERSVESA